jgi:hypothetical protein
LFAIIRKRCKFLYKWADQWILNDKEELKAKGTPVIVFGSYNYDQPKPWLQLIKNPKVLDISEATIEKEIIPFLKSILEQQKARKNFIKNSTE